MEELKDINNKKTILEDYPLEDLKYNLNQLILRLGYPSLKEGLRNIYFNVKYNILEFRYHDLLEELRGIFIPLKFEIVDKKLKDYSFNVDKPYLNDTLDITCYLELVLDDTSCVCITGFFPKNNLNLEVKTCQINRRILFNSKKEFKFILFK